MSNTIDILALNGVHAAGKSTMGERLEKEGFNYLSETAQKLIEEGEDWGKDGDHEFQQTIHETETGKDKEILESDKTHAVIETWHFGNIAHSMEIARSELVEEQKEYLERLKKNLDVEMYAIFLDMPTEKIWERSPHFEEGDEEVIDFYDNVRDNHFEIYDEFDIQYLVVENGGDLDEAYEDVREYANKVIDK